MEAKRLDIMSRWSMMPLFRPARSTPDRQLHNHHQPITIQKLLPVRPQSHHQFKHLPVDRLQAVVEQARADHHLQETTRSLVQALNLPTPVSQTHPQHTQPEWVQNDSQVSSNISKQRNDDTSTSSQHIPTVSTLLSEQGTQTASRAAPGHLSSLHLLRTLQCRLVDTLQQMSDLRQQGPWQQRVTDQLDWDRKLTRMDEFHASVTRQMYILRRQVDLIMETVCGIPETRVKHSVMGDVIRKLVRAHRSALRLIQAFVQCYWDGSLDGRQAVRFLEVLTVCRSLVDVCSHLGIRFSEIADLPERLASLVEQHVTTSGDVGSLIREMALGRFGPAAEKRRCRPQPSVVGRPGSHPHKQRRRVKALIGVDKSRASNERSQDERSHQIRNILTIQKVDAEPRHQHWTLAQAPCTGGPSQATRRLTSLPSSPVEGTGILPAAPTPDKRFQQTGHTPRDQTDAHNSDERPHGIAQGKRPGSELPPVGGPCSGQLSLVLTRLDMMQRERDEIRRRWEPLIQARRGKAEDVQVEVEDDDLSDGQMPCQEGVHKATTDDRAPPANWQQQALLPSGTDANTSTPTLSEQLQLLELSEQPQPLQLPQQPQPLQLPQQPQPLPQQPQPPELMEHPHPLQLSGQRGSLQGDIRQLFTKEAVGPDLRSTIAAELTACLGSSTDNTIKA